MFGSVRIGTRQQRAEIGSMRQRGPDLVSVDLPSALDAHGPGTQGRQVGPRTRFTEQLAPGQFPAQRGGHETFLQFRGSGRHDAGQNPFGNADRRPHQAGSLAELLVHDELLTHGRVGSPRRGPVRGDQPGIGQQDSPRPDRELRIVALSSETVVGQGQCVVQGFADPGPEIGVRLAEVYRHVPRGGGRQFTEVAGPARYRADRGGQAGGPAPVEVQVVFPGESDRSEHGQRLEHQAGNRHDRSHRGRAGGQPVLVGVCGAAEGAHRIPGRRRRQRTVHQQHRRLVLQRLERPDRLAELFTGAQVFGDGVHTPLGDACGHRRGERHGQLGDQVGVQSGQHGIGRHRVIAQAQQTQIRGQVGAAARLDLPLSRTQCRPSERTGLVGEGHHDALRRTHAQRQAGRTGETPTVAGTVARDVGLFARHHDGGGTRGDLLEQRLAVGALQRGQCGPGDRRGEQGTRQQRRSRGLQHAGHVFQPAALPTHRFAQVHGMKTVVHQCAPPGRQPPCSQVLESCPGRVDRCVPSRELLDGLAQLLLFGCQCDGDVGGHARRLDAKRLDVKNRAPSAMASVVGLGRHPSSRTALP